MFSCSTQLSMKFSMLIKYNTKRGNSTKTRFSNSFMSKEYGSGKIFRKRRKAESFFLAFEFPC